MKAFQKFKRSIWIGLEGLNLFIKPVLGILISLIVIRDSGAELWGKAVLVLIVVEFSSSIVNWGIKPFLLREFSLHPKDISENWILSFISRTFLLIIVLLVIYSLGVFSENILLVLGLIAFRFLSSSLEPIIQYRRSYSRSILAEVIAIILSLLVLLYIKPNDLSSILIAILIGYSCRFIFLLDFIPLSKPYTLNWKQIKGELVTSFPFFALALAGLFQSKGDLYVVTYYLSDSEIAFYQIIIGLLIIGQTFSAVILGPFQKNIYRFRKVSIKKMKQAYLGFGFLFSFLFSGSMCFVLVFFYHFEINYWIGLLFFFYLVLMYAYLVESQVLLRYKRETSLLMYTIISGVSNIVFSLVFVFLFGIEGALISGIISRIVIASLVVNKTSKLQVE